MAALKRALNVMPADVRAALEESRLMELYRRRPPYQQNDYIGWINRAKREQTKQKRLAQMLAELRAGDKYMGMNYRSR